MVSEITVFVDLCVRFFRTVELLQFFASNSISLLFKDPFQLFSSSYSPHFSHMELPRYNAAKAPPAQKAADLGKMPEFKFSLHREKKERKQKCVCVCACVRVCGSEGEGDGEGEGWDRLPLSECQR